MKMCEGVEVDIQVFLTRAVAGVGRPEDVRLSVVPDAEGWCGKYLKGPNIRRVFFLIK